MSLWQFTSVDTMKDSRDTSAPANQLSAAVIQQGVNLCATLSVTHITVDVFYDYPTYIAAWVAAVRVTGKKVWFRMHWNHWEGNNGQPADMSPTLYLSSTVSFIQANPTLFQAGDIFDACAEPELSPYWNANFGGATLGSNAPNAATDAFNSFILSCHTQMQTTLQALSIFGVLTNIRSTNSFFATHTESLYLATTNALGYCCYDSYPEASSTDPATCAAARLADLQSVIFARPNTSIIIGEMGYSNLVNVTDQQQNDVLTAELAALTPYPQLVGVNYWVAQGTSSSGGFTHIFGNVRGAWTLRPAAITLANVYAKMRLGWLDASTQLTSVAGSVVLPDARSLQVFQAINQRSTARFRVLDPTGMFNFLQGMPVSVAAGAAVGQRLSINQASVEVDLTGFRVMNSSTLTRVTTQFLQGVASLQVVTAVPGNPYKGVYVFVPGSALAGGLLVAGSVYLKGNAGGEQLRLLIWQDNPNTDFGVQTITLTTGWVRYSTTALLPTPLAPNSNYGILIDTGAPNNAYTWFCDAFQLEAGSAPTLWSLTPPVLQPPTFFTGYVMSARRQAPGWTSTMIHDVSCVDGHYLADKRIGATTYANQTCGFMVTDLCNNFLVAEGVMIQRGINLLSAQQSDVESSVTNVFKIPGSGVTLSTDPSYAFHGKASLKVVTDGVSTFQSVSASAPASSFVPGAQYTLSLYIRSLSGTPSVRIFMEGNDQLAGNHAIGSTPTVVLSTTPQRFTLTATMPNPIVDGIIGIRIDTGNANLATTFFIDGLQIEAGASATAWELGGLTKSVQAGPTVASYLVNYVPISKAFDDLAQMAGFTWQIDVNKVLWFTAPTLIPAPWTFDGTQVDDSPGAPAATVEETNPLYRNSQWILSIKDVTSTQTESRKGDGANRVFVMSYPLHSTPTITVNGGAKTVGIGQVDTGKDFYWNQGKNEIFQDSAGVLLISTDTFQAVYVGEWTSNVYSQNAGAVTVEATLEGGTTGIVEEAHSDASITTTGAGFQLAAALLARYGGQGRTIKFRTRTAGLAPQQLLTIILPPAWGMANVQALIQDVTISEDSYYWIYDVTALVGPVSDTWVQYFQRIANPLGVLPGNAGSQATVAILQSETGAWNWASNFTATVTACPTFPWTWPVTFC